MDQQGKATSLIFNSSNNNPALNNDYEFIFQSGAESIFSSPGVDPFSSSTDSFLENSSSSSSTSAQPQYELKTITDPSTGALSYKLVVKSNSTNSQIFP